MPKGNQLRSLGTILMDPRTGSGLALESVRTLALCDVASEIDASSVDPEVPFQEQLNLDSMDFLNYVTGMEEDTGILIAQADYPKISTLSGCVRYILSAVPADRERAW
jgi:acyl carrier protein